MKVAVEMMVGDDEAPVLLAPGDIIGRSPRAALSLDDPRVSEAHAMVSLRGSNLVLLRLRGRLRVHGRTVAEDIIVEPGLAIEVAPGLELRCLDVLLPDVVPGIEIMSMPAIALAGTMSIWTSPARAVPGAQPDADAIVWAFGDGWRIARGPNLADLSDLVPGETIAVGHGHIRVIEVPVAHHAMPSTRAPEAGAIVFVVARHAVHLHVDGGSMRTIGGMPGRLLGELLRAGGTIFWRDLADRLWLNDQSAEHHLRRRFDAALARLRDKLALVVEGEFVSLDGAGGISFHGRAGDSVEMAP